MTALTARRVRYGVGADLICQPSSFARYKDALVPRRFFPQLSPPLLFPSLPLSHLPAPAPSYLNPRRAPLTPYRAPPVSTEPIRRSHWEKCRSATADSHSLDASAALSHRPSDSCVDPDNDADEAPGVPEGRRRLGHTPTSEPGPLLPLLRASSADPSDLLTSPPWSARPRHHSFTISASNPSRKHVT